MSTLHAIRHAAWKRGEAETVRMLDVHLGGNPGQLISATAARDEAQTADESLQDLHNQLYRAQITDDPQVLVDAIGKARLILSRYRAALPASGPEQAGAVADELALIRSVLRGYPRAFASTAALHAVTKLEALIAAPGAAVAAREQGPGDEVLVACITLNGTTLTVETNALADMFGTDDEQHVYGLTFKRMARAAYEALGEFHGF